MDSLPVPGPASALRLLPGQGFPPLGPGTTNSQGPHYRQFLVSSRKYLNKSDSCLQGSANLRLVPGGLPVPATSSQRQSQILLGQGVEQARQGVVLARQNILQARQGLARDKQGSYGGQAGRLQVELHPEEQLG